MGSFKQLLVTVYAPVWGDFKQQLIIKQYSEQDCTVVTECGDLLQQHCDPECKVKWAPSSNAVIQSSNLKWAPSSNAVIQSSNLKWAPSSNAVI